MEMVIIWIGLKVSINKPPQSFIILLLENIQQMLNLVFLLINLKSFIFFLINYYNFKSKIFFRWSSKSLSKTSLSLSQINLFNLSIWYDYCWDLFWNCTCCQGMFYFRSKFYILWFSRRPEYNCLIFIKWIYWWISKKTCMNFVQKGNLLLNLFRNMI